jgi:hypothetical protein
LSDIGAGEPESRRCVLARAITSFLPDTGARCARFTTIREIDMPMFRKIIPAAALASVVAAFSAPSFAKYDCYDFSGLAPGTRYTVGDVVNARHSTVSIRQYFFASGNPSTADERGVNVTTSKIAGGAPPELGLYLVSAQVQPHKPIQKLRVKLAQSISQTGGFAHANIEVNGERHHSPNGFAGMNGRTIGQPAKGRVSIVSSMAPHAGNWQNGTLELTAVSGGIESVTLGAHTWHMDDYCIGR